MRDTHVSVLVIFDIPPGVDTDSLEPTLASFYSATRAGTRQCLYYGFARCGSQLLCREGYTGAEGFLTHVNEVKEHLDTIISKVGVDRVKILCMGPAAELDKIRPELAGGMSGCLQCSSRRWTQAPSSCARC